MKVLNFDAILTFVIGIIVSYLGMLISDTAGIIMSVLFIGSIIVGKLSDDK